MDKHKTIYHIYGRTQYTEPLAYLTDVQAEAAPKLEQIPLPSDAADWIEIVAFPESAVIRVIPTEEVT